FNPDIRMCFFFQAEDGIRDFHVTGVQTCALPILFEVKSTNGDVHLGGDDFDQVIINWLADEFEKEESIDLRKDPMALQRLKEAEIGRASCRESVEQQQDTNVLN